MDINQIIKDNLPDGVEISDKAISIMSKAISKAQGEEFVPKETYRKRTDRIDELEAELKEAQGSSTDAADYKKKWEDEQAAHQATKAAHESEKINDVKRNALKRHLQQDGANPEALPLLVKEFDLSKVEIEGDGDTATVKDWDNSSKPVKTAFAGLFGKQKTQGPEVGNPPQNQAFTQSSNQSFSLSDSAKLAQVLNEGRLAK